MPHRHGHPSNLSSVLVRYCWRMASGADQRPPLELLDGRIPVLAVLSWNKCVQAGAACQVVSLRVLCLGLHKATND